MLVLTRKKNQSILIGDQIKITVVEIRGGRVRLGIDAPKGIAINRQEIHEAIQRETDARKEKEEVETNPEE